MPAPRPIQNYVFTEHALAEMARRGIGKEEVATVLAEPDQSELIRKGRAVYQSKQNLGQPPKEYVVRVFVDVDRNPPEIVTAYRTSKVDKYWR